MPDPIIEPATIIVESSRPRPCTNRVSAGAGMTSVSGIMLCCLCWPFLHHSAQPAVAHSVETINDQPGNEPINEPFPGYQRQLPHEPGASRNRPERHPRHER